MTILEQSAKQRIEFFEKLYKQNIYYEAKCVKEICKTYIFLAGVLRYVNNLNIKATCITPNPKLDELIRESYEFVVQYQKVLEPKLYYTPECDVSGHAKDCDYCRRELKQIELDYINITPNYSKIDSFIELKSLMTSIRRQHD